MVCGWCGLELAATKATGRRSVYCGQGCRQRAFRLRGRRRRPAPAAAATKPIRVAYADPPYPGLAAKYYRDETSYAGEVDHVALVSSLLEQFPDGWALSTSRRALRFILPLCPESAHLCPWVKPIPPRGTTKGLHTTWEALIVVGGRQRAPGLRDWLLAKPAKDGGTLVGRKPLAFCGFLFDALGLMPGDELVDLYPGTGIVGRAWANLSGSSATFRRPRPRAAQGDVSSAGAGAEASSDDTSPAAAEVLGDETSAMDGAGESDETSPVDESIAAAAAAAFTGP